eukprot:5735690-Pyramimonas_sp.AAC.1
MLLGRADPVASKDAIHSAPSLHSLHSPSEAAAAENLPQPTSWEVRRPARGSCASVLPPTYCSIM